MADRRRLWRACPDRGSAVFHDQRVFTSATFRKPRRFLSQTGAEAADPIRGLVTALFGLVLRKPSRHLYPCFRLEFTAGGRHVLPLVVFVLHPRHVPDPAGPATDDPARNR